MSSPRGERPRRYRPKRPSESRARDNSPIVTSTSMSSAVFAWWKSASLKVIHRGDNAASTASRTVVFALSPTPIRQQMDCLISFHSRCLMPLKFLTVSCSTRIRHPRSGLMQSRVAELKHNSMFGVSFFRVGCRSVAKAIGLIVSWWGLR